MSDETNEEVFLMYRYLDRMIINRRDIERKMFVPRRKELLKEFDRQIELINSIINKLQKT